MKGEKGTEMKKITSLLVALTLVFALFSCGGSSSELDEFIEIWENSEPTTTVSYYTVEKKSLKSDPLNSTITTVVYEDGFELSYELQTYQTPGEGVNEKELIKTESGTVYYNKGQYSVDGMETWVDKAPDIVTAMVKFDLDAAEIEDYEVSADAKQLTATLTAEQATALLGVTVNAGEDGLKLVIKHDGDNLRSITVSYTTDDGISVNIVTSYTYDAVTSPFAPPAEDEPAQDTQE